MLKVRDPLPLRGCVEIFVTRGKPTLKPGRLLRAPKPFGKGFLPPVYESCEIDFQGCELLHTDRNHNIVVKGGKNSVIRSLSTGFTNIICRMAVGDRGTLPSDSTTPKSPTQDMTVLYDEVYRADVDVTTLTVTDTVHEIKLTKTFSASDIPITSFSNQAAPVVNEVGLITADLLNGNPLPRTPNAGPYIPGNMPDADEMLFAMRTFKSVSFEVANDISITVRYTIYVE